MPRKRRIPSPLHLYHIVIRGADRQIIFSETNDYQKYLNNLLYYKTEMNFEVYAFCLMSNHVHLLIYSSDDKISDIFQRVNTKYAVWFNMKYQRTGFLQQGRLYSEPITSYQQLFAAIRYIHQNPMKAGLEDFPGNSYLWSSIYDYKIQHSDLVSVDCILSLFETPSSFYELQAIPLSDKESFLDIDTIPRRLPDDVAKELIEEVTGCKTPTEFQQLSILLQNQYLIRLHQKRISVRQLNRLTGIPRGIIERTIQKA